MNNEFFEALAQLCKERGIAVSDMVEKIRAAIVIAVKKDYEVEDDNVLVEINPEFTVEQVQAATQATLIVSPDLKPMC